MSILAKIMIEVNSDGALRGILEHLPRQNSGVSTIRIEYPDSFVRENQVKKNGKASKTKNIHLSNLLSSKDKNGRKSIGKIICDAFANKSEFTNEQARDAVAAGGWLPVSASSVVFKLIQQGYATRVGIARYKIIRREA